MSERKNGKKMYRLIACDLDETLLNDKKTICKQNLDAIKRAKEEFGVYFVPATGRGFTGVHGVLTELDVRDKEQEFVISNNGGIITENLDERILTLHTIDFSIAELICKYGFEKDVCVQVFTPEDVYAFHLNEDERTWLFMFKPDSIECGDLNIARLKDESITKILFQNTNTAYLRKLASELEVLVKGKITISYSSNRYLEINAAGVNKGLGLKELATYLHIDMSETMAIGDNYNDIDMLQVAGCSIAVGNANEDIKKISDYICKYDHNQGAVAEAIEHFIFKGK